MKDNKIFRFVFDLAGGVEFGSKFFCEAKTKKEAWKKLESKIPCAKSRVKRLEAIS